MDDDLWSGGLGDSDQILQRNHCATIGAYIVLLDVLGLGAELFVGLHVNAVGAVVEIEIVHVGRAHVYAQRICDLLQRNVQALGLFPVNRDQELGVARGIAAEQASEIVAGTALPHQILRDISQLFQRVRTLVLHFKLETPNPPSPETAGGKNGSTIAPEMANIWPRKRSTTASAECSAPLRLE